KATARRRGVSFTEQLSRLTWHQACKLLGDDGDALIRTGSRRWEVDPEADVYLGGDLFRVRVRDQEVPGGKAVVVLTRMTAKSHELHLRCDQCETPCEHAGAALELLLEEKLFLGLAAPPDESVPLELLNEQELHARAVSERKQRAAEEKMTLRTMDPSTPWTDYVITSHKSGKSYRIALRGEEPGQSYCSCPDFRTNHLGTCKHILHTIEKVRARFKKKDLNKRYQRKNVSVRVHYGDPVGVRFNIPAETDKAIEKFAVPYADETLTDAADALERIRQLEKARHNVHIYPDAEEWIEQRLTQARLRAETADILADPASHPLRRQLLKTELLPYQMQGIAFAVGTGRAVLADDMGLGKTIQGIGAAELLAQMAGIERVLVVCPASLKSQWRDEIHRFCDRSVQLVLGRADERTAQYNDGAFFTVCNYEQVMRDLTAIEAVNWDLIILDEGQRIKNWESKTSQVVRSLHSRFALVLSGTPLENRLDELYTVVQFVDDGQLGPAYKFLHKHRIVDENGRVQGYKRLDELREQLRPILLRRTRGEVMEELPERTNTVVRITPTEEQLELHAGFMRKVVQITSKKFLTEMDLLQLQKNLLMCRMTADSTFLADKEEPGYSSKLDRLGELLEELSSQTDRKIVLFSEWRTMLNLIEPLLERLGMDFVRLDGQVPQKQRPAIVRRFQEDPDCRAILMTNAGSTGLNLQSANVVINVDLPWNPAVLEQRIARAHRMGQKNPVHVYLLVTEGTLEEKLLDTLAMKQDLAMAALDVESDVAEVHLESGMEELRRRLERLLGETPDAPIDRSQQDRVTAQTESLTHRRERVAAAGGQLIGAALSLVGELIDSQGRPAPDPKLVNRLQQGLAQSIERDETGRPQLRITLPNDDALTGFAETLARLLVTA
ncbi:MAG: DEAD/DEAH box helicase, partial [Planctomycetaceae bacterium]